MTQGPSAPPNSPPGDEWTMGLYVSNLSSVAHDVNSLLRSPGSHAGPVMFRFSLVQRTLASMSRLAPSSSSQLRQQWTIIQPGAVRHDPRAASLGQMLKRSRHLDLDGAASSGTTRCWFGFSMSNRYCSSAAEKSASRTPWRVTKNLCPWNVLSLDEPPLASSVAMFFPYRPSSQ